MKRIVIFLVLMAASNTFAGTYLDFDFDWLFSKNDFPNAMIPAFDDSSDWQKINLPHDWSIEGPFSADYGSGNGYVPGGIAWYRKHFSLDDSYKGKIVAIEFDGVYDNSEVWINGQFVGRRPYGYSSFQYDLTPFLNFGIDDNVIAVRVDHTKFADSRWYTGSGIYRHVRLRISDKLHIAHWGTYVTTPEVSADSALVRVETAIKNDSDQSRTFSLLLEIASPDGKTFNTALNDQTIEAGKEVTLTREIKVSSPQLWSVESPELYALQSRIVSDSTPIDQTSETFGIRTIKFDPNKGFFLNDKSMKMKGVCLHHDAGCLGAAVPDKVLERRLLLMKELGANAIRTSHNPPAPELLDMCDKIGLLVMDEAFDEFTPGKNKWVTGRNNGLPSRFGYAEFFTEWSVIDISDMVRRDRNHPSIIMWSIGNEVDYPNDPFSDPSLGNSYRPTQPAAENLLTCARPLVAAVKKLDSTRPVTAALASITMSNAVGLPELLDIVGYNYQEQYYEADHQTYPERVIYGSENDDRYNLWTAVTDNDYISGQFLWTGIDYLGEANRFPNRANGAGLADLCGFKKPIGWFRQSLWSEEPMVYIAASQSRGDRSSRGGRRSFTRRRGGFGASQGWNLTENSTADITCYTNCQNVSLYLNDKLIGTQPHSDARAGVLSWSTDFEPGTLRAVGINDGKEVCQYTLSTAGSPAKIELKPDVRKIKADGKDICHIEFQITDEKGVIVPTANNEVKFEISGPGKILGIENGDLNSTESYQDLVHNAYNGRGLAILQSIRQQGSIEITASASGLGQASIRIEAAE